MTDEHRQGVQGGMSDGAFLVTTHSTGRCAVVELRGELDIDGANRLTSELGKAMGSTIDRVEIDASGLGFVDSAGLQVLVTASEEAQARGIGFAMTSASPLVKRVVEIAGLRQVLMSDESP